MTFEIFLDIFVLSIILLSLVLLPIFVIKCLFRVIYKALLKKFNS